MKYIKLTCFDTKQRVKSNKIYVICSEEISEIQHPNVLQPGKVNA